MMRGVKSWVAGVLAGVYQPEPDEEPWEWAMRTLKVPRTENEEWSGRYWSPDPSPYVKELMEWAKRPGKGEFWIKKSSQVGFTMAVLILICWMIVHRSGQVAYAIDSIDEARKLSKTRLKKWVTDNRLLDEVDGGDEDDLSNLTYFLSGITVYLMGAHSKGAWANKSLALAILDELDKHPLVEGAATSDHARERVKRPKDAKIIGFSTPGESGLITLEHSKGTCEVIDLPCPHCDAMAPLKWENFVYDAKEFRDLAGELDLEKVASGAYFKCELCGGRFEERHKAAALQRYQFRATNPKATPGVRSLHIWDAYSTFVTFGELAVERINAEGNPAKMERFMNGRRGLAYERSGGGVSTSELLDLKGAYKRGEMPLGIDPLFYAMAVDVQQDCSKATKAVFTATGECYVIDWDRLVNFEEILDFADVPLKFGDREMTVQTCLVDEGNGDDTKAVREFCLSQGDRFYPVKGRGRSQIETMITTSESWHEGEEVMTYHVNDPMFKWELLFKLRRNHYSAKKQAAIVPMYLPADVDEDEEFLKELTQEIPMKKKNAFGHERWEWVKKGANDFWDTLKYLLPQWSIVSPGLLAARASEEDEAA